MQPYIVALKERPASRASIGTAGYMDAWGATAGETPAIPGYFAWEWDRNNFPIGITIEYSTTGQAGGYLMDSAPESTHQPVQPLGGS